MVVGMDLFALLAACSVAAANPSDQALPAETCQAVNQAYQEQLQAVVLSSEDRQAIARVAYAEAANQGDAGLAGVVYTILNRFISGRFGDSVTEIVNAPHQFEPVHKANGWKNLPALSAEQLAGINTIINLALDGRLPDPTAGALFFQNPTIVAAREQAGSVSAGLTHFGGSEPTAVIKDHAFYAAISRRQPTAVKMEVVQPDRPNPTGEWDVFSRSQTTTTGSDWNVFDAKHTDRIAEGSWKE